MYLAVNIIENLRLFFNVYTTLDFTGWISTIIEILIIAFVISQILMWVKNTRAWFLLRGLLVIALFILIAVTFNFQVIIWILKKISLVAVVMIIVLFQDDLRQGLEHLGRQNVLSKIIPDLNKFSKKTSEDTIQEIVEAAFAMSAVKTGALMVIEQTISLEDIERTGILINGKVTRQLIINIFEKNTPLHDGAVLIVGDIVKAATCYLPLSHDYRISKALGTRHRAALGVSEISDSITVVVSEETGNVSVCINGNLEVMKDEKELLNCLIKATHKEESVEEHDPTNKVLSKMKGWFKNEK